MKKSPSPGLGLLLLLLACLAHTLQAQELPGPPFSLKDVRYTTQAIGPGTYAVLSDQPIIDNSGFVVGEQGVLVIDAPINGALTGQVLQAVRRVTDKPIRYLVNTNYNCDHTCGNSLFPEETAIIAHHIFYASTLMSLVRQAIREGQSEDETAAALPYEDFPRPPGLARWYNALGFAHERNVRKTYQVLAAPAAASMSTY